MSRVKNFSKENIDHQDHVHFVDSSSAIIFQRLSHLTPRNMKHEDALHDVSQTGSGDSNFDDVK